MPAVTNAHGSTASSQYGPKPATYGSTGYGAYDALGQSAAAQDYAKSAGYTAAVAHQAAQQKGQQNSTSAGSAANDIANMYGKSHAALGKVNVSIVGCFFIINYRIRRELFDICNCIILLCLLFNIVHIKLIIIGVPRRHYSLCSHTRNKAFIRALLHPSRGL